MPAGLTAVRRVRRFGDWLQVTQARAHGWTLPASNVLLPLEKEQVVFAMRGGRQRHTMERWPLGIPSRSLRICRRSLPRGEGRDAQGEKGHVWQEGAGGP